MNLEKRLSRLEERIKPKETFCLLVGPNESEKEVVNRFKQENPDKIESTFIVVLSAVPNE